MKEGVGFVGGKPHSEWPDAVRALKRAGKVDHAERLLLELVEATELEARVEKQGVAPWYYEQLAIIYSQRGDYAREVAILERYQTQPQAAGSGPKRLAERLAKTRRRRDYGGNPD